MDFEGIFLIKYPFEETSNSVRDASCLHVGNLDDSNKVLLQHRKIRDEMVSDYLLLLLLLLMLLLMLPLILMLMLMFMLPLSLLS